MPRYFFHVHNGELILDREGAEFPDDATARREAVVAAATMLADDAGSFWDCGEWVMMVGEGDREVCILNFSGKTSKPK